jgi:predicted transcriptional regulator
MRQVADAVALTLGVGVRLARHADAKKINFNEPAPLTDEEDDGTLAEIDREINDADEGRIVPLEEVRRMIPEWISKFESRKKR